MSSVERVFVAGAGLMGHGIAQVHAAIGRDVDLYEPDLARAQAGLERIPGNLARAVAKGRLSAEERAATLARIHPTDAIEAVAAADLVIEADFEALAVKRELGFADDRLNVNGGAIALGHPLGATGAKLVTQLVHALSARGGGHGLVTMCIGGGMGAAGVLQVG